MQKYFIQEGLFLLVLAILFTMKCIAPEKLTITTSFRAGQIYLKNVQVREDKNELKNDKRNYIAAEVKNEN